MAVKQINELTFIGSTFTDTMMDGQKTFTQTNMEMENDETFKKFLADNDLTDKRTSMVVFGPENFMYWYGVVTDKEVNVPTGLMKFALPKAEIAEEEESGEQPIFNLPLNVIVPQFFKKLTDEGVEVFENPGDSETPYLLQDLDLKQKKLKQIWYIKQI